MVKRKLCSNQTNNKKQEFLLGETFSKAKQRKITDFFSNVKKEIIIVKKEIIIVKKNNSQENDDILDLQIIRNDESDAETLSWYCLECGIDMGPQNPRQLCGKWRCSNL
jgi:hypothetical protein